MITHLMYMIICLNFAVFYKPLLTHDHCTSCKRSLNTGNWFIRFINNQSFKLLHNNLRLVKYMGRTKEIAWRNTYAPKMKLKQAPKMKQNQAPKMKRKHAPNMKLKFKIKKAQKLLNYDDLEIIDLEQDQHEPVENVSPMLDSLFDDDVELLDPEHDQHELDENASLMSDFLSDDHVELLDPAQDKRELEENASPMSHFLEKPSSSQSGMTCVQGYKVKHSSATILEAIFKKHGDIAANCIFKTDSVRSSFLEVICEVIRRLQTDDIIEKLEEIECQVSDAEAANINVSWLQSHLEAIHKMEETSKNYSLLMETKSNTILVKRAAQIDLRERSVELVAAQQQFEKAEKCVRVLHLVEKNLNDSILESKCKIDSWVMQPVL